MDFADSLDATLKQFKITAKALSESSGVAEASISRYRRKERDINADSLERMIKALPQDAKQFLFCQIFVGEMDKQGLATLLSAIAYHLKTETTDNLSQKESSAVLSLR